MSENVNKLLHIKRTTFFDSLDLFMYVFVCKHNHISCEYLCTCLCMHTYIYIFMYVFMYVYIFTSGKDKLREFGIEEMREVTG